MPTPTLSEEDRREIVKYRILKPKLIDRKFGLIYNQLFSLRLTGDYEDRRNLDLDEDVMPLVKPAKELIDLTSSMAKEKVLL